MKRLSCIVFFLLTVLILSVRADGGADDQYLVVYSLIQDADALSADHPDQALAKYQEAYADLQTFQKVYPDWNDRVVTFRLKYLQDKIAVIAPQVPNAIVVTNAAAPTTGAAAQPQPAATSQSDQQIAAMNDQLKQLVAEKTDLQSKLKEAYTTQPAAVDPHELAVAREKIQSLLKENDLLKVSLTNQAEVPVQSGVVDDMKRALADANRRAVEETARANNLALEKQILLSRLANLASHTNGMASLDVTKNALDNANEKLAAQTDTASKLAQERDALLARVEELTRAAATAEALSSENEGLKRQLSDALATNQQQARKLNDAQVHVAALASQNDVLNLEKAALEDRIKQYAARPVDQSRITQLETERDNLKRQLAAATDPAFKSRLITQAQELSVQVNAMRARLDVLEARAIPYTPEELALFKKSPAHLEASTSTPANASVANATANSAPAATTGGEITSVRALPPGTAMLAAQAQRDFNAGKFDLAQEKYNEILQQDSHNIYTLANLAAIELEMNDLVTADKHITQAIGIAPDDAYNLKILGYLRFRQERYDDALDALSRAAKAEPQSAEIQNYLGVTLSHKGMRIPAETALRKAIEIDPAYGNAHNNLAVIYATQTPPLLELARWHYQKALASGQPRNAELEKLLQLKAD